MTTNWLIAKLRNAYLDFVRAKEGNTVVMFALALLPLVTLTGMAVDYSRASSLKTAMQAAADATALAMAQSATADTAATLQSAADTYFRSLLTRNNPQALRSDAQNLQVTATYSTTNGSTVLIQATATYPTDFVRVIKVPGHDFSNLPLTVNSTSSFGNSRLRVALVLDNTGSMAQSGKITALKTATNNLLTQLKSAATNNGDVYVSIVPFVKDVNVDPGNYSASWIYWDDAAHTDTNSWDANNGTCSQSGYYTRQDCVGAPGGSCSISGYTSQNSCTSAGSCSISGYTSKSTCTGAAGSCSISGQTSQSSCTSAGSCNNTKYTDKTSCVANGYCSDPTHHSQSGCTSHGGTWHSPALWSAGVWTAGAGVWTAGVWSPPTWTPNNHNTWNGCVMDRGTSTPPGITSGYDENVVAPNPSTPATLFPAEQYSPCPQAAMGLNYNWSAMTTEVSNMSPGGNTNQAIGLELGWMSLVGGGPFTAPAMDPNYTYQQVIILLTDGLNTQDRWYGTSDMCTRSNGTMMCIDARQEDTCDNIKSAGITLYTIQVNTDAEATSKILQYCASSSDKFFLLTSSSEIVTTFNTIGTNLSRLHIAK